MSDSDGERSDHFEGGRTGKAGAEGHVAPQAQAEAGNLVAFAGEDGDHAHRVVAPVLAGLAGRASASKVRSSPNFRSR